jgi:hypothetical protein
MRSACPAAFARPSMYAAKRFSCGPGADNMPTKQFYINLSISNTVVLPPGSKSAPAWTPKNIHTKSNRLRKGYGNCTSPDTQPSPSGTTPSHRPTTNNSCAISKAVCPVRSVMLPPFAVDKSMRAGCIVRTNLERRSLQHDKGFIFRRATDSRIRASRRFAVDQSDGIDRSGGDLRGG